MRKWMEQKGMGKGFLVCMHVWGSWESKRWNLEKFAAVADKLIRERGARIIIVWGPGEKEHAVKTANMCKGKVFLAPATSLKELGALISLCDMMIANDSGPMHIGAAVGTPTVGIFGPTSWKLQGPYGEKHASAYHSGLSCLGCNRLKCSSMECMNQLSVERVFDTVESVIRKNKLLNSVVRSNDQ
jgi:ADP-heptose:LPS heptosyltransferase